MVYCALVCIANAEDAPSDAALSMSCALDRVSSENRWSQWGGNSYKLPPGAYPSPFKQGPSYLPHLSSFPFFPVMLAPHVSVAFHGFLLRRGGQQTLPLSRAPGAVPGLTSQLLQIRHAVYSVPAPAIGSKHCGWAKQEDRLVRP